MKDKARHAIIAVAILLLLMQQVGVDFAAYLRIGWSWVMQWQRVDWFTVILAIVIVAAWLFPHAKPLPVALHKARELFLRARLKVIVSITAFVVLLIHVVRADMTFDAATLVLFGFIILPWLSDLIESAKLPGGWEVKFRDVQAAGAKVTSGSASVTEATELPKPSYLAVADHDPNLALVGLRIEIEKRVRELAKLHNLPERRSLSGMIHELGYSKLLETEIITGLLDLIGAGNNAAHGAMVEPSAARWAIDVGPQVLAALDAKLDRGMASNT